MTSTPVSDIAAADGAVGPPFKPSPFVAFALNLVTQGTLGYLYVGRPVRAVLAPLGILSWFIALTLLSLAAPWAPLGVAIFAVMLAVLVAALVILPIDAARLARRAGPAPQRRYQRWYSLLVVGLLLVLLAPAGLVTEWIKAHVAEAYRIPGGSMGPTLLAGDWVLSSKRLSSPVRRGDVVIYRIPNAERNYVHRVAGLPGDTLAMRNFHLLVNGRLVDTATTWQQDSAASAMEDDAFGWQRTHLLPGADTTAYRPTYGTWGPLVLRPGEVFVLGDERHNSLDSRYRGPVPLEALVGRPVWIYFSRDPTSGTVRWSRFGQATR